MITAGSITLKPSATFATATGTFTASPTTTIVGGQTVTITNGSTLTLTATDPVAATGTLTFGASNPSADGSGAAHSRVTIAGTTYRFVGSLTSCNAGYVLIGGTVGATADNLKRATNLDPTAGTNYCASTAVNSNVSATVSGSVVTVTAKTAGSTGNTL